MPHESLQKPLVTKGTGRRNPRLKLPLASLRKRDKRRRAHDPPAFKTLGEILGSGDEVSPDRLS
jgi:hypothetical protein